MVVKLECTISVNMISVFLLQRYKVCHRTLLVGTLFYFLQNNITFCHLLNVQCLMSSMRCLNFYSGDKNGIAEFNKINSNSLRRTFLVNLKFSQIIHLHIF